MDPIHGFTREEVRLLKRLLQSLKNRPVNTPQRPTSLVDVPGNDTSARPEVYVILTPEGGIPGATYTNTGSGSPDPQTDPYSLSYVECQVYEVEAITGRLQIVDQLKQQVYNLSEDAVPGDTWLTAKRDKYGTWLVESLPTGETEDDRYYPDPSGGPCIVWYTIYLHLASVAVYHGQILRPRQFIGRLGKHPGGAHLHFSLGDGDQSQNPTAGSISAGVSTDIESWLTAIGVPITGAHNGVLPSPPADFTPTELLTVQANFGFPLDESLSWEAFVSSTAHTGWDYWAIDFALPPLADQTEEGYSVFAAFSGPYVLTTVHYMGPGTEGYCIILRHQIGEDCNETTGTGTTEHADTQGVGPGLTFINFNLSVYLGCGLEFDADNAVTVNVEELVGDQSETSLVPGPGECDLAVDLVSFRTTTEHLVVDQFTFVVDRTLYTTTVYQTFTNHFNVAGLHIDRTAGPRHSTARAYDLCVPCTGTWSPEDCTTGTTASADIEVDLLVLMNASGDYITAAGPAPLAMYFEVLSVSGGTPPYFYQWWFDDPNIGSYGVPDQFGGEIAEHTYTSVGPHFAILEVYDSCGNSVRIPIPVHVTNLPLCVCTLCPGGAPHSYELELSGGTGDFEMLNGKWLIPYTGDGINPDLCFWQARLADRDNPTDDDITAAVAPTESGLFSVSFTRVGNPTVFMAAWEPNSEGSCCIDTTGVVLATSDPALTGTPPDLDRIRSIPADCGPCTPIETECCPDNPVPRDLYAKFSSGTGGLVCLNGLVLPIPYDGTTWEGISAAFDCPGVGEITVIFSLQCTGTDWNVLGSPYFDLSPVTDFDCDAVTDLWVHTYNTVDGDVTVTISKVP